jgi:phytoene dehydrogenase-like protein
MKKVIVVGAGVAGLSAGVYAAQSGFDVTIYESHTIPGGASTSWRRKGYLFEGGLHWMTGSSPKVPINRLWRETGALDDATPVFQRDPFFSFADQGQTAHLYRDPDRLRTHLTELSPEDRKEIYRLCRDIKKFSHIAMPVTDLPKLKAKHPAKMSAKLLLGMLPALPGMAYYSKMSVREFAGRFQSPVIRMLIENSIGPDYSATAVLFTLATLASGDGGYPKGGSLAMTQRMANRFASLGGTIQYQTGVERVWTENGVAKGVIVNGEQVPADAVIVTLDTRVAIDTMFDEPLREAWAEQMRAKTEPMLDVFIGLGVEADLSGLPESETFFAREPIRCGNVETRCIGFYNYAAYEGYAPDGCTAVTTALMGDSYDFWKACRQNGTYEAEKQRVAEAFIRELAQQYPQTKGKVAVWDVATPLTYERYLGSYKGSWMSLTRKDTPNVSYPSKPESIQRVYFAGQRLQTPGGLPVALVTGRTAVQQLCIDTDTVFQQNV